MTVAEYARAHGLPWSTAKRRLRGAVPRRLWLALGCPGWRHARALPDATVTRICQLLAQGEKHEWIAHELGVGRSTVSNISAGRRRRDVSAAEWSAVTYACSSTICCGRRALAPWFMCGQALLFGAVRPRACEGVVELDDATIEAMCRAHQDMFGAPRWSSLSDGRQASDRARMRAAVAALPEPSADAVAEPCADLDQLRAIRAHPALPTLVDSLEDELAQWGAACPEHGDLVAMAIALLSPEPVTCMNPACEDCHGGTQQCSRDQAVRDHDAMYQMQSALVSERDAAIERCNKLLVELESYKRALESYKRACGMAIDTLSLKPADADPAMDDSWWLVEGCKGVAGALSDCHETIEQLRRDLHRAPGDLHGETMLREAAEKRMESIKSVLDGPRQVSRDAFLADPVAAVEAAAHGPVQVRDDAGALRMTISSPSPCAGPHECPLPEAECCQSEPCRKPGRVAEIYRQSEALNALTGGVPDHDEPPMGPAPALSGNYMDSEEWHGPIGPPPPPLTDEQRKHALGLVREDRLLRQRVERLERALRVAWTPWSVWRVKRGSLPENQIEAALDVLDGKDGANG